MRECIQELKYRWKNYIIRKKSNFINTEDSKRNLELKNLYWGKRCFVLGNGPSLNKVDVTYLKEEVVIVVNSFFQFEKYQDVQPDIYIIFDPLMFDLRNLKELKHYKEQYSVLRKYEKKPIFIVPLIAKGAVRRFYKWEEWTKVYYIDNSLYFYKNYAQEYDITRPVPGLGGVIKYGAMLATYMGVKNIYYLGAEQTIILDELELYVKDKFERYAYKKEEYDEVLIKKSTKMSLDVLVTRIKKGVVEFGDIYSYCKKRNIGLYNCTPASMLDNIPYKRFTDLITH